MSSTSCPDCAGSRYPDLSGHCPDCHYPHLSRLTLTGDAGSSSFGVRTRLGSALLLKLSKEANYAERAQFSVFCHDADWFILPVDGTKNDTLLNGVAITGEGSLKDGDVVALGSRSDSKKQVMPLRVGIDFA